MSGMRIQRNCRCIKVGAFSDADKPYPASVHTTRISLRATPIAGYCPVLWAWAIEVPDTTLIMLRTKKSINILVVECWRGHLFQRSIYQLPYAASICSRPRLRYWASVILRSVFYGSHHCHLYNCVGRRALILPPRPERPPHPDDAHAARPAVSAVAPYRARVAMPICSGSGSGAGSPRR